MIQAFKAGAHRHTGQSLPYLLYTPDGADQAAGLPLVVFLHGAGERGDDLAGVRRHGPFRELAAGRTFPCVIAAPQIERPRFWGCYIETLNAWLDGLLAAYPVDPARVCLTGLSMGGFGTWEWGTADAARFAALAPLCGGGMTWAAGNLTDVPIWAFHGDADVTVPVEESIRMTEAVNRLGGGARLTVLPGVGHDCWTQIYAGEALWDWLLRAGT